MKRSNKERNWRLQLERNLERIQGLRLSRVLRRQVWLRRAILNVPLTEAALHEALKGHTRLGRKGVAGSVGISFRQPGPHSSKFGGSYQTWESVTVAG